jgi:hypothetical protein
MIRCAQAEMLFQMAYLVGSPDLSDDEELADISWGLFQVDEDGRPGGAEIAGLHESVLWLDPTGREMCPSPAVLKIVGAKID